MFISACILFFIFPLGHSYISLVMLGVLFGVVISSGPTLSTPLIVDLIGIQQLNNAFGKYECG